MQSRETRTMHHAACDAHVRPAMRSKHRGRRRAGWHTGVLKGYSRGTQGVLKGTEGTEGTQGYSDPDRMHASTLNADRAPCGMPHARPTSDALQASSQTTRRPVRAGWHSGVLRGYSAAGRRACNEQSGACSTRCAHAAWQVHPSAGTRRDNTVEDQPVPAGTTACVHGRCGHSGSE